ncbi:MAG: transcription termination/antitermination protein NusA, partial [Pseudomonadota bacterium]
VPGVTTTMMIAFGENDVKNVEDLADCATDDLVGWVERKKEKDAEPVRHAGILDGFDLSREDAENLIMSARVKAGWIDAADLLPPEPEEDEAVEGSEDGESSASPDETDVAKAAGADTPEETVAEASDALDAEPAAGQS